MGKKLNTIQPGFLARRDFLKTGATVLTALSAPAAVSSAASARKFPQAMLQPGVGDEPYGQPSNYEQTVKRMIPPDRPGSALKVSYTPIHLQRGIITPAGLHFTTHHSGIANIDPQQHQLYIHGMTDKPLKFSVQDLMRYPLSGGIHFLECSGNTWWQGLSNDAPDKTCIDLYGLMSGSEWLGVPVKLLLKEAGIHPKAKWVIAEGSDSGTLARSIPLVKMMDDAIIALYQNGERLRPAQGYPMRLFLPGWEGNTNVKWLRRLEVTDQPAYTKDESRSYTETLIDGSLEGFSLRMGVKSVIIHPSAGHTLPEAGFYEVSGLAWSGFGKIQSVEVSDDGGKHWYKADLHKPVLSRAHTRFSLPWRWSGKPVRLQSRAIDERGNRQPTRKQWHNVYALGSYNHYNAIQVWQIDRQGRVNNVY